MRTDKATTEASGPTARSDDEFAWRVLDQMPTAVLVVDSLAKVIYANAALVRLVGHFPAHDDGVSIFDYVHPDDASCLGEAYLALVQEDDAEVLNRPSIHIRIISADGEIIPLEVTGARAITDRVIGGVIYEVRLAHHHDVLGHVLAGLSAGDAVADLLGLVAQLIALPPLDLEAAVLECDADDGTTWRVVSSTSDELADALARGRPLPLDDQLDTPVRFADHDIDPALLANLHQLGFVDVWRVSLGADGYEIIACSRRRQHISTSVTERLSDAHQLAGVVSVQAKSERRLRRAAEQDVLTGVYNRAAFRRHLAAAIDCAVSQPAAVLFLDLNDFKPVNDQFGHAAGDAVLRVVTQRLRAAVRPGDIVARLGGDEFGVLLVTEDSVAAVSAVARRIVDALTAPISIDDANGDRVDVSVSVGASNVRAFDTVDAVLGRADRLMYDAKRSGGGQVRHDMAHN